MEKKGQITIFIIIALVLVGIVGLYFSLRGEFKTEKVSSEVEEIYIFVHGCIEETGVDAIYEVSQKGGYFLSPDLSTEEGIPYYYVEKKYNGPSKEKIALEISHYMNTMLFFCTKNFEDFPEFVISQEDISTTTKIENEKVIFNVDYPLRISKGESINTLKNFNNIETPIRLGLVYDSIGKMFKDQEQGLCLSCVLDVALQNDLYVDMSDYDEETIIFTIRDINSNIEEKEFSFNFANKY